MDILLISPPIHITRVRNTVLNREIQYNFGLCCLSTNLSIAGFKVGVIDAFASSLTENDIIRYIKKYNPKIIAFSTLSVGLRSLYSTVQRLKNYNNIILGGYHFTIEPNLLKVLNIKYGLIGEADYSLVKLCEYILHNKGKLEEISGLVYNDNGRLKINKYKELSDLDSLPTPSFNHFLSKISKVTAYLTFSRGCKFNCIFCSRYGFRKKYVYRKPEKILEDIKIIFGNNTHQYLVFTDETLTMEKEPILKLCELLQKEKLNIPFGASTRIDCLDEELLEIMAANGLKALHLGIESGSERIRALIGKPSSDEDCKKIVKLCKKLGIYTICFFIIGLPDEKLSDIKKTMQFVKTLPCDDIFFNTYITLPGAPLYKRLEKEGYVNDNIWIDYMKGKGDFPIYIPKYLKRYQLEKLEIKAHRQFYINMKNVKNIIFNKDRRKLILMLLIESMQKELLNPIKYLIKYLISCQK